MVREYELGLVINPDQSDEQIEAQLLRVGQFIESHDGEIIRLDRWGKRRLAYLIQRHREGYYAFLTFSVESEAVREIERFMLVQEDILRHLIVFLDPRTKTERQRRADAAAAAASAASAAPPAHPPVESPSGAEPDLSPAEEPETVAGPEMTTEPDTAAEPETVTEPDTATDEAPEEASATAAPADQAAEDEPTPVE